ncbi:MAG: pyridoxal 5'-phosphate synthase glutaminase subunit PdxT [Actinomycetota bacterium]|jgi:5'-phosphate synthase pdxT subunit
MPRVGVLALQGDVREHVSVLKVLGVQVSTVKTRDELAEVEALIIPGGESTTMSHLLEISNLRADLSERLADGLAVLGTCAGLILLSKNISDGRSDQWSFGALDVDVRRNGYGRQVASFETLVEVAGIGEVQSVFIRAPRIERFGSDVEILASLDDGDGPHPVLVRQGAVWGCSFHPELTTDSRIHGMFVESIVASR